MGNGRVGVGKGRKGRGAKEMGVEGEKGEDHISSISKPLLSPAKHSAMQLTWPKMSVQSSPLENHRTYFNVAVCVCDMNICQCS